MSFVFTIFTQTITHPVKILNNHCFQILLGITVVPREIEDNGLCLVFRGGGGLGGGGGGGGVGDVGQIRFITRRSM